MILFLLPLGPTKAQTTEEALRELKAQVRLINARIKTLERKLEEEKATQKATERTETPPARPAEIATAATEKPQTKIEESKRPLEVPRIDTSVTIGGRVKLDVVYNSASTGGTGGCDLGDISLIPATIPVDSHDEDGQTCFSARESRLWIKSRTPTDHGDLAAYFEMDFLASQASGDERVGNSHAPRLRHGYGALGNLLVGQTWTTFMNVGSFPELNDSTGGPVGIVDVRQPQVRWTQPFAWGDVQIALESPETTLTNPAGLRVTPSDDRLPDVVTKLTFDDPDWGQWSIAGLFREIRSDGATVPGISDAEFGGAVSLGGRFKTFGQDNIRFNFNYGNALGRYIALNAFNEGSIDAIGNLDLNDVYGAFIAYQHWWSPTLRSTLSYSRAGADNDLTRVPFTVTAWVESYHANLLWSPWLQATLGLEYIHACRVLENGHDGELDRIQFSAIYNF